MKKIFLFLVMLSCIVIAQNKVINDYYFWNSGVYSTYSPFTDTVVNITPYSATLIGNDNKTKSNKLDTLATKKTPYRYMVIVGVDSLNGKQVTFTGLTGGTEYSYYYSMFIRANDGDSDYYRGEIKTFTTPVMLTGTYILTSENKYWTNSNGKFITLGD